MRRRMDPTSRAINSMVGTRVLRTLGPLLLLLLRHSRRHSKAMFRSLLGLNLEESMDMGMDMDLRVDC